MRPQREEVAIQVSLLYDAEGNFLVIHYRGGEETVLGKYRTMGTARKYAAYFRKKLLAPIVEDEGGHGESGTYPSGE